MEHWRFTRAGHLSTDSQGALTPSHLQVSTCIREAGGIPADSLCGGRDILGHKAVRSSAAGELCFSTTTAGRQLPQQGQKPKTWAEMRQKQCPTQTAWRWDRALQNCSEQRVVDTTAIRKGPYYVICTVPQSLGRSFAPLNSFLKVHTLSLILLLWLELKHPV